MFGKNLFFPRKETLIKEEEACRVWTAKFDPWLIKEYREVRVFLERYFLINNGLQMYDNIAKVHGISREDCVISLKRNEWQQPVNAFPPLHKRLTGQRRRRVLGAFPETENDVSICSLDESIIVCCCLLFYRKLVGEFYHNKLSKDMNVLKRLMLIQDQNIGNFLIGLSKVSIN